MKWLFVTPIVAIVALAFAAQNPFTPKPKTPEKEKAKVESEKDRIEREIEGLWEVFDFQNPKFGTVLRWSGYMLVREGCISINAVVTTKDPGTDEWTYHFTGSMKRYTITETNRLRLEDVFGFSNPGGVLKPDVAGTIEERVITFIGLPEIGQKLRISRGADDSMTFIRRTAVPKPAQPAAPNDK
ncbi:MAG: hypothetical protein ACKVS6_08535 [Planctomycetota bacterium]